MGDERHRRGPRRILGIRERTLEKPHEDQTALSSPAVACPSDRTGGTRLGPPNRTPTADATRLHGTNPGQDTMQMPIHTREHRPDGNSDSPLSGEDRAIPRRPREGTRALSGHTTDPCQRDPIRPQTDPGSLNRAGIGRGHNGNKHPRRRGDGSNLYRIRGKLFFLTYPQCPFDAAGALQDHCRRLGAKRWIIAREHHGDGGEHLHAVLEFETPQLYHVPTWGNFEDQTGTCRHGNYQSARSAAAVMAYVSKAGNYILHGYTEHDLTVLRQKANRQKQVGQALAIGEALLRGERVEQVVREYPQLLITRDLDRLERNQQRVLGFNTPHADRVCDSLTLWDLRWTYIRPLRSTIDATLPCIVGGPNLGKTTTVYQSDWRIYAVTTGSNWYGFRPDNYDLILLDDWGPTEMETMGYRQLIAIVDGRQCLLNIKGGQVQLGTKQLPLVMVSNHCPSRLFPRHDPAARAAATRFTFYRVSRSPLAPQHEPSWKHVWCRKLLDPYADEHNPPGGYE